MKPKPPISRTDRIFQTAAYLATSACTITMLTLLYVNLYWDFTNAHPELPAYKTKCNSYHKHRWTQPETITKWINKGRQQGYEMTAETESWLIMCRLPPDATAHVAPVNAHGCNQHPAKPNTKTDEINAWVAEHLNQGYRPLTKYQEDVIRMCPDNQQLHRHTPASTPPHRHTPTPFAISP